MITEQPKAPQGINNRPNPETTNTISRLQREMGGRVCGCVCVDVEGTAGYEHVISICACIFTFASVCLHVHVCVFVSACLRWLV